MIHIHTKFHMPTNCSDSLIIAMKSETKDGILISCSRHVGFLHDTKSFS
jgi:hypothetical protein